MVNVIVNTFFEERNGLDIILSKNSEAKIRQIFGFKKFIDTLLEYLFWFRIRNCKKFYVPLQGT